MEKKIGEKKEFIFNKRVCIKALILMSVTIFAFWIDLDHIKTADFSTIKNIFSFRPFSVWYLIFIPVLFLFYSYVEKECRREVTKKPFAVAVALLFAVFLLVGESFECTESLNPIIHGLRNGQTIKSGICFAGYFILMYNVTLFLFAKSSDIFSGIKKCRLPLIGKYGEWIQRKPFLTVFITLIIAYIPYMVASYPGIFLSDETAQIYQGHKEFRIIDPWYFEGHLFNEEVYYNNNHPIVHTLFINLFIDAGIKIFHSGNAGVFAYTLTQTLAALATIGFFCRYIVKKLKVSSWMVFLLILYYALSPRIQNYMMVTTKDIYYSLFLSFFVIFLYSIITERNTKFEYLGITLSGSGIFFFRNEGRYILLLAFVLLLVFAFKKQKLFAVIGIGAVISFSFLFTNVILPGAGVTPGSIRETYSVPFQQTARYIRDEGKNVTQEEKNAISRVLPYDEIAGLYDPNRSDYVKATYYEDATDEDRKEYFKAWGKMFFKKPRIYIEATINNYYQYLYPGKVKMNMRPYGYSETQFDKINVQLGEIGIQIYYPDNLDTYRNNFEFIREYIANIPIISLLITAATYSWWLLYLFFYAIYKKSGLSIALMGSCIGVFLICFMGPCNGFYCRYSYPLMMVLPIVTILVMTLIEKKKRQRKNNYIKKTKYKL